MSMTNDLSDQMALFTELFNNSPVPYILIDQHSRVTLSNTAACRLYGVELGGLAGLDIFSVIESDDETHMQFVSGRLKSGTFVNDEEVRIVKFDEVRR